MARGRYISNREMESIIVWDALAAHARDQVGPHIEKMGKEPAKRFRTAITNFIKGLQAYDAELSDDDRLKLQRYNGKTRIIFASNAYNPKDNAQMEDIREGFQALAEFAIGQNCTGCTKDGETCSLKHLLAKSEIPYATTEPENCPYEQ